MHGRVHTVRGATSLADGIAYLTADVLPLLHQQPGYRGGMASIDEAAGVLGFISLWEDEIAREAGALAAAAARTETVWLSGGDATVETFDRVESAIGRPPPQAGCRVRFVSFQLDAARAAEGAGASTPEGLAEITGAPGFRGLRTFTDSGSGRGLTALIVTDDEALEAAEAAFEARRAQDEARGISFGEIAVRQVLLIDRP